MLNWSKLHDSTAMTIVYGCHVEALMMLKHAAHLPHMLVVSCRLSETI